MFADLEIWRIANPMVVKLLPFVLFHCDVGRFSLPLFKAVNPVVFSISAVRFVGSKLEPRHLLVVLSMLHCFCCILSTSHEA
jgi:hypothetical protein